MVCCVADDVDVDVVVLEGLDQGFGHAVRPGGVRWRVADVQVVW